MEIIRGLRFHKTCDAYPEQYDVYSHKGEQVGYVRLRWGGLRCDYPECLGETIYCADIGDGCTGEFESQEQRMEHLRNIANKILEKMNE